MHYREIEELYDQFGGKFAFTVMIQKRVRELVKGEKRLIKMGKDANPLDVAVAEAKAGRIRLIGEEVVKVRPSNIDNPNDEEVASPADYDDTDDEMDHEDDE